MNIAQIKQELKQEILAELRAEFLRAPNRDCYNYREVAEMAEKSESTIRLHERQGKLIARFPLSRRKFQRDDVEKYLRGLKARKGRQ